MLPPFEMVYYTELTKGYEYATYQIGLAVVLEVHLDTRQLSKLLLREIYIFSNVCQQIITETKLS